MNLANKITIFRIILVPIILIIPFFNIPGDVWGVPLSFVIIDVIFVIASLTDYTYIYYSTFKKPNNKLG